MGWSPSNANRKQADPGKAAMSAEDTGMARATHSVPVLMTGMEAYVFAGSEGSWKEFISGSAKGISCWEQFYGAVTLGVGTMK